MADNIDMWDVLGRAFDHNPTPIEFKDLDDIEYAWVERGDYAEEDVTAICRTTKGDWRWVTIEAGCDTTGWDCQSYAEVKVFKDLKEAVRLGLTQQGRRRLNLPLVDDAEPVPPPSTPKRLDPNKKVERKLS